MAESEVKMALAKENIPETKCEICMEDDRKSHILPCGHGLCLVCIDSLVNDGESLECPFCRAVCKTSDEGFPANQWSTFRKARKDVSSKTEKCIKAKESQRCSNCKNEVQAVCNECEAYFCYGCVIKTTCSRGDVRHQPEALDILLEKAEDKLNTWKNWSKTLLRVMELDLTDTIERKQGDIDKWRADMKKAETMDSSMCAVEKITLINKICWPKSQIHTDGSSRIPDVPSGLKLVSQYETGDKCYSVCFNTRTADLLLGCTAGMKVFTRGSYEVKEETQHQVAITAVHKGQVFISQHHDRKAIKIFSYNIESKVSEMLFSFPMESDKVSYLTVYDQFVACIDRDTKTLKLYDRREKNVQTLPLPGLPHFILNIYFLQDGSLLATGADNRRGYLNKYRISTTKGAAGEVCTLIWSCPLLNAYAIAVSDDGKLIFVSEIDAKRIYVVRPNGTKLCELNNERLS